MNAPSAGLPAWIRRHTLARLVVMGLATFAFYIVLELAVAFAPPIAPSAWRGVERLAEVLVCCAVLLGAYRLLVRGIEKRSAVELRASAGWRLFLAGSAFGAVLFSLVLAVLAAVGLAAFAGFRGPTSGVLIALAMSLLSAVGEEIVFRGCLFRILEEGFGSGLALVVSAGLFGLIHWVQPGASLVSTLAIALEAGILLALTYAAAGNLWLPIGLHFGWNFAEGGVFSQAVSGGASAGLVKTSLHGPTLLTGGAFGPEASLVAVAVSLAASAALAVFVVRTGRWRPAARRFVTV